MLEAISREIASHIFEVRQVFGASSVVLFPPLVSSTNHTTHQPDIPRLMHSKAFPCDILDVTPESFAEDGGYV